MTKSAAKDSRATYRLSTKARLRRFDDDAVIARAYEIMEQRLRFNDGEFLESPDAVKALFRARFSGQKAETFDVAYLSNRHKLIEIRTCFTGCIDSCSVYPRQVIAAALELNAAALVLAHNHPSGVAEPSRADVEITKKIQEAAKHMNIRVLDHLVCAETYAVSLAERGEI